MGWEWNGPDGIDADGAGLDRIGVERNEWGWSGREWFGK